MSPFIWRKLRAMSTVLTVLLAVAIAGVAAWLVRRMDDAREPALTECSQLVTDALANSGDTADSLLVARLLPHRDRCTGDAGFVDQLRRLLANDRQFAAARALLEESDRRRAFTPDELTAQIAWVDAAESHDAWANGDDARARQLLQQATASASSLREKWPEWSMPYRILEEANRSGGSSSGDGAADYFQMERDAQGRKLNGAWIRSQYDTRAIVFTFVLTLAAMLALFAGIAGYLDAREIMSIATSQVASASPGYVELKGTLHVAPRTALVIGPHTKEPAVWYEMKSNSGMKKATTRVERSYQPFLIRDASGEIAINPQSISVHTKHSTTRFGNSAGQRTNARLTELLLKEGDPAYVLGELQVVTNANGESRREIAIGKDGRRLFVSNYSEAELVSMEKMWMALGSGIFVVLALLLAWSYYQRYHIASAPGSLL